MRPATTVRMKKKRKVKTMEKQEFAVFLIKPKLIQADAVYAGFDVESAYMDYRKPKLIWKDVAERDLSVALEGIDAILMKDYGVKAVFQLDI